MRSVSWPPSSYPTYPGGAPTKRLTLRVGISEEELRQRLREERFAHAGRANEDERTHGTSRILEPRSGLADRSRDGLHGLVLADHGLVQLVFECEEPFGLFLLESGERYAGHFRDNLGDDFLIDDADGLVHALTPLLLNPLFLLAELLGGITEFGGLLIVGTLDGFVLVDGETLDLLFEFGKVRRLGHALEAQTSAGFVDHVDRLVGVHASRDVPS